MDGIVEKTIKNYSLYIAESHHHMLLPWAKVKRENKSEELLPNLPKKLYTCHI